MDCQAVEDQYLGDMKFFMQLVGMWPHQERFAKFSTQLFSFLVIIFAFITEVSRVIIFYSMDVLLDQMVYLDIIISIFTKQYHCVLNATKLKELLHVIVVDRMLGYPKEELEILDSYFNKAVYFCFVYKGIVYFCGFAYCCIPVISPILNIIKPLNESRGHELIYPAYYFVDEQRYYYAIIMHMVMGVLILNIVYVASDLCLIYIINHGCALLTISGYRFKHAFDEVSRRYDEKDNDVLREANAKVCRAIKGHKRAIEFMNKINDCYVHYFLLLLGLIIIGLTSTFIRLSMMEKISTYYVFCVFTVVQLFHLFFLMLLGQIVSNIHDEVYQSIYEAKWYYGSPRMQLLYVLVLRQCLNSPILTGEGLIPLNFYSFVQVLKASFSYYTVFNS